MFIITQTLGFNDYNNIMPHYFPSISVSVSKQDTSKADDVVDYDSPDGPAPTGNGFIV